MGTDADCADTQQTPPIPPQPPHRPPAPPAPAAPEQDPQTTVLRPVPAGPAVPPPAAPPEPSVRRLAGPMPPPAAPPTAPPHPATPPPAAGPSLPPRPGHPPAAPAPASPPGRPASFRDTAAFHLAHAQGLWNTGRDRADTAAPAASAAPERPAAAPPAAPGNRPAAPPYGPPPLPHPAAGPYQGAPAAPLSRPRRSRRRRLVIAACLVLGIGLLAGAAAGSWLTEGPQAPPTPEAAFAKGREVWHNTPVDTLFPRTVDGLGVGPGGSDRRWTRIAVAPDSTCAKGLDPALARTLAPVGCRRLLRATYVDATRSDVITVGALTAKADASGMLTMNSRFSTKNLAARAGMMPLPYAAKGTPAAGFGPAQRASWTVRILTDIPVVVYAVSGFADGRAVTDPQPAEAAVRPGATTAPAESGLGHDAKDLADRTEAAFRKAAGIPGQKTEEP
ncbi:hypothetical protein [Streptomyces sp. NPDC048650]|uniref:hypothetical protein n=1 Tax=Streptomyces sp. NPDC048650 TaxID=3365583 RepID=UPI003715A4DB